MKSELIKSKIIFAFSRFFLICVSHSSPGVRHPSYQLLIDPLSWRGLRWLSSSRIRASSFLEYEKKTAIGSRVIPRDRCCNNDDHNCPDGSGVVHKPGEPNYIRNFTLYLSFVEAYPYLHPKRLSPYNKVLDSYRLKRSFDLFSHHKRRAVINVNDQHRPMPQVLRSVSMVMQPKISNGRCRSFFCASSMGNRSSRLDGSSTNENHSTAR
jgi:hypothetical protein